MNKLVPFKTLNLCNRTVTVLLQAAIVLGISSASAMADSLAEKATNPIGDLIQLQIQDQYNFSNYNSDGYSNSFIVQPVVPISLP